MSRRQVVLGGLGLSLTVFGGRALAPAAMSEGIAAAAAGPASPVLVSVFLSGGVDTLSLMPPRRDAKYTRGLRPNLWVDPAQALAMTGTDDLGWHPQATALKRLHDRGRLTVAPGIGYEDPNGSHFTSRHFYEVGATDPNGRTGWLGRLIDRVGEDHNPVQGLTLGSGLSPVLATDTRGVAAVAAPDAYTFTTPGTDSGPFADELLRAFDAMSRLGSDDAVLGPVRGAYRDASDLRATLARPLPDPAVAYPGGILSDRLRDCARMLAAGLPVRAAAIDAQLDFDTHANQLDDFGSYVAGVGEALEAFQADLEATPGLADRVVTLVWSEFGRRPEENGSVGTDHGAAGLALLMGTRVRGGFLGEYPGLGRLDADGNLRATADFRALYCSLLEQWYDQDAVGLIPGAAALGRYALLA